MVIDEPLKCNPSRLDAKLVAYFFFNDNLALWAYYMGHSLTSRWLV